MPVKALFLDRDGVINIEKEYLFRIEDFEFVPHIFELCRAAQQAGYILIVITNQSGIGRGYYTEADFEQLTHWMIEQFAEQGITITHVYHDPTHPVHGIEKYKCDSYDRKPNPGMLIKASKQYNIELSNSILVGDKDSDIEAGNKAGIGCKIRLLHDNENNIKTQADFTVSSLEKIIPHLSK
jgi:D-glycero-D-manno-heptose 1,7-bisphosphate phosphatase